MKITWIGHSCFRIENKGFVIITDPYTPGSVAGLKAVEETAQLVCCSHSHADHAGIECVKIEKSAGNTPAIRKIPVWHDEVKGKKRGANTIHIFDFPKERVVHMGDIGCDLGENEILALKDADVLMIPVGGYYTIGPEQAAEMVRKIRPRIAIPMHYRDEQLSFGHAAIGTVDKFLGAFEGDVSREGCCIDTDVYARGNHISVIRMIPQNAE